MFCSTVPRGGRPAMIDASAWRTAPIAAWYFGMPAVAPDARREGPLAVAAAFHWARVTAPVFEAHFATFVWTPDRYRDCAATASCPGATVTLLMPFCHAVPAAAKPACHFAAASAAEGSAFAMSRPPCSCSLTQST